MARRALAATNAAGKEKSRRNPVVTSPMTSRSWTALWEAIRQTPRQFGDLGSVVVQENLKAYLNMRLRRGEFARWFRAIAASDGGFASDAGMSCLSFQQV